MIYDFKWIDWNRQKIAKHNVSVSEAEYVVRHPARGFPRRVGGTFKVWGQNGQGGYLQVVFVIEPDDRPFVIHARPLTETEKRQLRRGRR